jgi:hypothetical protein
VHAQSGAGKTALVAWVANKIHQLYPTAAGKVKQKRKRKRKRNRKRKLIN